ncbi:MAG: SDR family oxidoreductase [Lachnospiraceae bacterium]|nr:SDR family oxidoreductase [Lachnospiraceae bacterium]
MEETLYGKYKLSFCTKRIHAGYSSEEHFNAVNTPMNDGLAEMEGTTAEEIAERSAGNLLPVPWIETEDVVESVKFLASDKARYITGSQFVLDAGLLTR